MSIEDFLKSLFHSHLNQPLIPANTLPAGTIRLGRDRQLYITSKGCQSKESKRECPNEEQNQRIRSQSPRTQLTTWIKKQIRANKEPDERRRVL